MTLLIDLFSTLTVEHWVGLSMFVPVAVAAVY
jgi:general stress protein CsbA